MGVDTPLLTNNHSDQEDEKKRNYVREFGSESRTLWKLAGPAIFTSICQYSLGALTQTFAGLVGEIELAAVSVENSVIAGLAFGVMVMFPSLVVSPSRCFPSYVKYVLLWWELREGSDVSKRIEK